MIMTLLQQLFISFKRIIKIFKKLVWVLHAELTNPKNKQRMQMETGQSKREYKLKAKYIELFVFKSTTSNILTFCHSSKANYVIDSQIPSGHFSQGG